MGFMVVRNNKSKEECLALIANSGIRVYSSKDDTGASDILISNEEFNESYEIIGYQGEE